MSELLLPAVATRIYTACKKCDAERYHIVLAHTTSTSAKVECEICHSKKTYKLAGTAKVKRPAAGAALKKKEKASEARKSAHQKEYDEMMNAAAGDPQKYNMKMKFTLKQKIDHPKFGLGIVKMMQPEKIEVVFSDEVRMLVHNRV